MPKRRLLFGIIILLLITNIATLLLWNKGNSISIDVSGKTVSSKDPVASVNGEKIPYQTWIDSIVQTHGKDQLESLIDQVIVEQLAAEQDIDIAEKVIERELAVLMTMQGVMTEQEIADWEIQWREDIVTRYQLEALLTEDVMIPEEELRTYYDMYRKQYDFASSIQISHIVVSDVAMADKVIQELEEGASFSLLAHEYSLDDESTADGGYLGFYQDTSEFLPSGYDEIASQMEVHSYSEPFETADGVAVIYLHQHLPAITFTYDEIKPQIKRELALEKLGQSLSTEFLRNKLEIEWVYEE